MKHRFLRCLICLYPGAWRARYAEEFLAILDQRSLSFTDTFDIVIGAIDARIEPHGTEAVSERILSVMYKLRSAEITLFCAYIVFVVAGLSFQKMTEYDDFTALARTHAEIGLAYNAIVFGAGLSFLSMLVGGLPIAFATIRHALVNRQRSLLLRLAVPPISLAILAAYTFLLLQLLPPPGASVVLKVFLVSSWVAVFLLAAVISTVAVTTAIARSQLGEKWFRFALVPGIITILSMGGVVIAMAIWGINLHARAPELFVSNDGVFNTSTVFSLVTQLVVMAGATVFATTSLLRAWNSALAYEQ